MYSISMLSIHLLRELRLWLVGADASLLAKLG